MKFGLIGYGAWGKYHARAIEKAEGAQLAALCCKSEETAAVARADFPQLPVFRDYRELIALADLDVVDIVVPTFLHAEMGIAALEAGKDVLLEKPMALTGGECDLLISAAERNGRVLNIGHELRLSTQWGTIKEIVERGEIGDPLYANVSLFRFPYRKGSEDWRWTRSLVGSWILEEPIHFYDFVMWYFEKWGYPIAVAAVGNSNARESGLYDNFTSIVRFPNGIYSVITQCITGFEHHQVMEVAGKEGSIRAWWSGAMDRTLEPSYELKVQRKGETEPRIIPLEASGEVFELEEEMRRVVGAFGDRRPLVSGTEAKKRVVICAEAERSLREGREIPLSL